MNEFENVDIRQWVRDGLVIRALPRVRRFNKRRVGPAAAACVAISMAVAVGAVTLVTSVSSTQVQDKWSVTPSSQTTIATDIDLVTGVPEAYWSAMMSTVSRWLAVDPDVPLDIPPLV
jgi:hypothetical protein